MSAAGDDQPALAGRRIDARRGQAEATRERQRQPRRAHQERRRVELDHGLDEGVEIRVGLGVGDDHHAREAHQPSGQRRAALAHAAERDPGERAIELRPQQVHDVRRAGRARERRILGDRRLGDRHGAHGQHALDDHTMLGGQGGAHERGRGRRRAQQRIELGADLAAQRGIDLLEEAAACDVARDAGHAAGGVDGVERTAFRIHDGDGRAQRRVRPHRHRHRPARREQGARVARASEVVGHDRERQLCGGSHRGLTL